MKGKKEDGGTKDPLGVYLREIRHITPLTKPEEVELAEKGDEASLNELVRRNLKYVVLVANRYKGCGLSLSDLINEGNIGLIQAAQRFDPSRGVKFITYAIWWIRQSIMHALAEKSQAVKLPIKQLAKAYKINEATHVLFRRLEREPTLEEVAEEMDLKPAEIEEILRVTRSYLSLDAPLQPDEETPFLDLLRSQSEEVEDEYFKKTLNREMEDLLKDLNPREQQVVRWRYGLDGPPLTLQEIGDKLVISRERVRQIERIAKQKLRAKAMEKTLNDYLH
jgi:RNA polymerase primary sigma factor